MKKDLFEKVERRDTNSYKWDLIKEKYEKEDILPFWIADSDYETCPEVKEAILKRASSAAFGYTFASNTYFETLANWCKNHYGYAISKENTVITTGVVNALYFIVKLFTIEGDSVLVNPPVYNPFYNVITSNNRKILKSKLVKRMIDDTKFTFELDFKDLEEKISQAKAYILCNPHNPVGRCYTFEELSKIVFLCKKYHCLLISDEIHCDIIMNGYHHTSVGRFFNEYQNIIICTAPSKTFNVAGLACSNIFFNNSNQYQVFKEEYEQMSIECNVFGLVACEAAYEKGEIWMKKQNDFLTEETKIVYTFCKENHLQVCLLEGTYLMWIDMKRLGLTQEELFNGLIEEGVWINNGTLYDSEEVGTIRLNIACPKEQLIEGLARIKKFLDKIKK